MTNTDYKPQPPGWYTDPTTGVRSYWNGQGWGRAPINYKRAGIVAGVLAALLGANALLHNLTDDKPAVSVQAEAPVSEAPSAEPAPTAEVPMAPSTQYRDGDCDGDIVPEKDGICRVSDGGFLSTGLMSGWIETTGPRDGSNHCTWTRLSGPRLTIAMSIETGGGRGETGPQLVYVEKTDYAFHSDGCAPWKRVR